MIKTDIIHKFIANSSDVSVISITTAFTDHHTISISSTDNDNVLHVTFDLDIAEIIRTIARIMEADGRGLPFGIHLSGWRWESCDLAAALVEIAYDKTRKSKLRHISFRNDVRYYGIESHLETSIPMFMKLFSKGSSMQRCVMEDCFACILATHYPVSEPAINCRLLFIQCEYGSAPFDAIEKCISILRPSGFSLLINGGLPGDQDDGDHNRADVKFTSIKKFHIRVRDEPREFNRDRIVRLLRACPDVEDLSISTAGIGPDIVHLADAIPYMPKIQRMYFSCATKQSVWEAQLVRSAFKLPLLETLSFGLPFGIGDHVTLLAKIHPKLMTILLQDYDEKLMTDLIQEKQERMDMLTTLTYLPIVPEMARELAMYL